MQREQYKFIPTTYVDEDREEGRYTTVYTDLWDIEILHPLDKVMADIKLCKEKWELFRYKKLDEYSQVCEHFSEVVLDLSNTKILWYKEHHVIDDIKKQRELNAEKLLEDAKADLKK